MVTLCSTQTFQPCYKHTNTSFPLQMVKMKVTCSGWRHIRGNYMGGGTGLADPATTGPMVAVRCLKTEISEVLNSKIFPQLLGRVVSLIAGLEQDMEGLCKVNGAPLHCVLSSFVLFHSVRPQQSLLYCR